MILTEREKALLPAARFTLIAVRFETSGQYSTASGYNQLLLPSATEAGPGVCSDQRLAISGKQAAVQLQCKNVY